MKPTDLTAGCLLALALALPSTALAHQCPALMANIDELINGTELTDEDRGFVTTLRQQGEELHQEGEHDDAVSVLEHAMELLSAP